MIITIFSKVYVRTSNGTVIHINPACRIPRTIKRFSGLMGNIINMASVVGIDIFFFTVQLLERGCISGNIGGNTNLLEVLPLPVKQYLPENALKIGNIH